MSHDGMQAAEAEAECLIFFDHLGDVEAEKEHSMKMQEEEETRMQASEASSMALSGDDIRHCCVVSC